MIFTIHFNNYSFYKQSKADFLVKKERNVQDYVILRKTKYFINSVSFLTN